MQRCVLSCVTVACCLMHVSAQDFQEILYEGVPLDVVRSAQNPVTHEVAIAVERNPIIIWDVESQSITREFPDVHLEWESLTYSPDGRFLGAGTYDGTTVLYDAVTGMTLHTVVVESPAYNLSFSPDSTELVIGGRWILDTTTYTLTTLADASNPCVGAGGAYLPESNFLFTAGIGDVCVWDATSRTMVKESASVQGGVSAIKASPAGDSVVVTTKYGPPDVLVLDASGEVRHTLTPVGGVGRLGQIDFSTDGSFFVAMSGGVSMSGNDAVVIEPLTGQTVASYDSSTFQSPTTYRIFPIYGGTILDPATLLLVHGSSGLSLTDLSEVAAQARLVREAEVQRLAQAEVTRAQQEAEAERLEAERQAQENEEIMRQALADAQADQTRQDALKQIFELARSGTADQLATALQDGGDTNVSVTDEFGQTPLMYAAGHNEPVVVRLLVNLGADVNQVTDEGWTALMYAARDNTLEMVETLVELGAEVNAVNDDGDTALELASAEPVRDHLTRQITAAREAEEREAAQNAQRSRQQASAERNRRNARHSWGSASWLNQNTLQSRYVADMLEYAVVEVIACPDKGLEDVIAKDTSDYVCLQDVDNVAFVDDVDAFLEERQENINLSSEWLYDDVGSAAKYLELINGYEITLFSFPNYIMVAGIGNRPR